MDIDTAVDRLADLLEQPLVLYDTAFNVVAYSAHAVDVDEARRMTILSRRGTTRAREMIRTSGAAKSTGPVRLPVAEGQPERIVVAVRHESYVMGYLVWVEPGAPSDVPGPVRDLLDRHGPDLGRLLAVRDLDSQEQRIRQRVLIFDLMSDDAGRRADAARGLVLEDALPAVPEYRGVVLVIPGANERPSSHQRTALESALVTLSRGAREPVVGAVLGNEVIAILAAQSGHPELGRLLAREPVRLGMGAAVAELSAVESSVRQARLAARAGLLDPDRYGPATSWDDLGLDRLLLQLPLDRITTDDLPPAVARLLDPSSAPDLAITVEAYLDHGADGQETAKHLTIHRSTLYYRLDRIREVTGVDLRDGTVRRELHTGLRVARLAGLVPVHDSVR